MNPQTERDIKDIYNNSSINLQLVNRLIYHLNDFENNQEVITPINTRNDKGEPLGYFDCFHKSISKKDAFIAGGIQKSFPNIRFVKHNVALKLVDEFCFPYQQILKTKQVCVELREETIDIIPILFWCQLQWFTYKGKK